jgi:hypothetical protein
LQISAINGYSILYAVPGPFQKPPMRHSSILPRYCCRFLTYSICVPREFGPFPPFVGRQVLATSNLDFSLLFIGVDLDSSDNCGCIFRFFPEAPYGKLTRGSSQRRSTLAAARFLRPLHTSFLEDIEFDSRLFYSRFENEQFDFVTLWSHVNHFGSWICFPFWIKPVPGAPADICSDLSSDFAFKIDGDSSPSFFEPLPLTDVSCTVAPRIVDTALGVLRVDGRTVLPRDVGVRDGERVDSGDAEEPRVIDPDG